MTIENRSLAPGTPIAIGTILIFSLFANNARTAGPIGMGDTNRGDDKLKISSRKVSIWESILQTILSKFQYIFCFDVQKNYHGQITFSCLASPGQAAP